MLALELRHFMRAAQEIAAHGDNDTLPFDIDTKFCGDNVKELATIAWNFYRALCKESAKKNHARIVSLPIVSERLIAPSGPAGFRVVTKVQAFWNMYLNGLSIGIAESLEPHRDPKAHSYRFMPHGGEQLFDPLRSWRAFKQATVAAAKAEGPDAIVVQTDISSFYEHISHHHIENFIGDLGGEASFVAKQVNALLSRFSAGRSFGIPIGGQAARVIAELVLKYIDDALNASGVNWNRYVDDFVLIAPNYAEAYKALSTLAQSLQDYGLTLSRPSRNQRG